MGVRGIIKFFTIRAVEGIVAILLITFMPNLPPDAKYSQSYSLTPVLPFEGSFTLNDKLQSAEIWHKGDFIGPEAFAVYNGELYTTIHGGNVVKLIGDKIVSVVKFGKQCKGFYQEHICGRPLGMQFDKQGGLYVADSYYGIFKVDVKTGKQLQLVSMDQEINGKKPKLPNSVAIASNGDIYWTDSSTEFFLYDGVFDMLADGSGRLIHYDAKTKKNTVLIDKLHFANGVRLATDESFVITTETARCRVYRYYLQGPKKGTYDVFLDGLPGLPDNIQTDGKDGFLIPLVIGRDDDYPPPLNIMGPFPLLRKFLSRVLGLTELGFKVVDQIYPCEWAERAVHYIGHFASIPHSFSSPRQTIMHISKDGVILDTIHSLNGSIVGISEAFIFKDMLYMGSPFNDHAARIPLEKVGWGHLALKESDYPSSSTATETANAKVAPESKTIPAPTQQPKVTTQPTPKAATPSQPTTPPSQKVTKPIATPQETSTQVPKVATPTPSQSSKQSPSPPPTKQSPPSTKQAPPSPSKQTQPPPPPPTKQTAPPAPTKQTPPPTKQTAPPAPTKQTLPPSPTKQTPPPSPTKETPPPPPTKQTSPPTPTKQTAPPPPTKQTAPPAPTKQTSPPSPTKESSPPPPVKQTAPPAPTKQTSPPPPTKQTPPPSPTKQTPPPPPAKQTSPPPPVRQTSPPPPTKQTPSPPPTKQTPPPPPAKQTPPPPPAKQTQSPPPAKETQPPSPVKQTQPPPPSTQPPKATTATQVPKVDTYTSTQPSQQLPSPSVKQVPKEESSQSQGPKASTTAKEPSTQPTKPSTDPPKVSTTPTTQNQATPKQAPQPVGTKNEL
ncbi:hypothetical protein RI129_003417 [Pyrocoelia pectoralis]|uniref:Strictosidine synthase conserved region domain-containing protein n=1 Tax=Pyrocoelia pectoralis TaxID=417401 RepID=A0AAN7VI81_9COLE